MSTHVREIELRRLFAGELSPEEAQAFRAHLAGCEDCRGVERALEEEKRRFEAALPFEQFARGVERLLAPPAPKRRPALRWVQGAVALAACLGVAVLAPRLIAVETAGTAHGNRLKGGAEVELRIGAGSGPQRVANPDGAEALGPGERVRIGYRAGGHRYLAAVSVDATGEVSALYPEEGQSLPVSDASGMRYLPGSLEFTGHGAQRVIVVLSDEPLQMSALLDAARAGYRKAGGELSRPLSLAVPGEQFQRMLQKP